MEQFRSNFQTVERKEMLLKEKQHVRYLENDLSHQQKRLAREVNL